METKNLMAVVPQAGATVSNQGRKNALDVGKEAGKDSFGDALGKIGKDVPDTLAKATADGTQGSAADNGDVMEDAPKDPLAAVIAASQQIVAVSQEQGENVVPQIDTPVVALDFSEEGQAVMLSSMTKQDSKTPELQSLIPQSEEEGLKNRDFLAMLSGQQLKGKTTPLQPLQAEAVGREMDRITQPATNMEAQLLSVKQGDLKNTLQQTSALDMKTPLMMRQQVAGMAPAEQMETVETNLSQQPMAAAQIVTTDKESKPISNLLNDVRVSVETEVTPAPIRMDTQQAMNQSGDQNPSNQQSAEAEVVEVNVAAGGKMVQQLAEEAVGDKPQVSPSGNNTSTNAVSAFQQQLQESIEGPVSAPAADVKQVQDDFDIPRQIVDQARLIRRAADTQMVIKLNPEHLGELTLKVSVTQNGSVNASFHSDNAQVRAVIENSLVQLRQELNNQGLKVDSVEVYAGLADGQLPQQQGQQAWQEQQGRSGSNVRVLSVDAEDYAEEADNLSAAAIQGAEAGATDGVDYRI